MLARIALISACEEWCLDYINNFVLHMYNAL